MKGDFRPLQGESGVYWVKLPTRGTNLCLHQLGRFYFKTVTAWCLSLIIWPSHLGLLLQTKSRRNALYPVRGAEQSCTICEEGWSRVGVLVLSVQTVRLSGHPPASKAPELNYRKKDQALIGKLHFTPYISFPAYHVELLIITYWPLQNLWTTSQTWVAV